MTNTDTADAAGSAAQVIALANAGSQLVRVTVNNDEAAAAVPEIVRRVADSGNAVPIIGDFHYNGHLLLTKYPETARLLASTESILETSAASAAMKTSAPSPALQRKIRSPFASA